MTWYRWREGVGSSAAFIFRPNPCFGGGVRKYIELCRSDLIYSMFPVNYKLFSKLGPSADAFREHWYSLSVV